MTTLVMARSNTDAAFSDAIALTQMGLSPSVQLVQVRAGPQGQL